MWNVYDDEERELEASLYFSAPVDNGTMIDLRWLRTLVLHTLELLYYQSKWESLAHLALLFNTYTRYAYNSLMLVALVCVLAESIHITEKFMNRIPLTKE